ncbi:YjgF-like protein [Pseudovirgaria hyperparasitica]|uniref:YjgF-like protein n=1 Tax=Pseudovirgaria hyperparasitica TaxID=470096 RepID=A0A6A6VZ71_9PEZI|nr:YjgF-like protein [Pseudovirgaria hyperparasitica]KAF2755535.1 YjgF-like protein [Pseudovirgaria hyperparasitica]
MASSNKPQAFNPKTLAAPPPSYDQVCITPILPTSKLITIAGQIGRHPEHDFKHNKSLLDQAAQAYENVANALAAAGATPRDITFVRHYIVQDSGDAELNKKDVVSRGWAPLWIEFMDSKGEGHRPPDTVVGVASLATKEILYEVEVVAVIHS